MSMDTHYEQDEKTVLVNARGERPVQEALTDFSQAPRYEELEQRMIYAASREPLERFNIGINPLESAAAPLFSALVQVKATQDKPPVDSLREVLRDHLLCFERQLRQAGLEEGEITTARYVLSTVTDETVVTTRWGSDSGWSNHSLLHELHKESFGGEKFFQILERTSRDPVRGLALLELMFICLCLGFEGKYRVQARGMADLEEIHERLYWQIRHVRGDVPRDLSPQWEGLRAPRQQVLRIVPGWLLGAVTATCLAVMFCGFAFVLGEKRETVLRLYQPLDAAVVQPHS